MLRVALLVPLVLLSGGVYSAMLGWRPGAFLAVAGLFLTFAWHLAVGLFSYRRTMTRPWPKVPPIDDDDW